MVQSRKNIFRDTLLIYERDERPLIPSLSRPEIVLDEIPDSEEEIELTEPQVEEAPVVQDVVLFGSFMKKMAFAVPAFMFVFAIAFSLNGSYTGGLIKQGVASAAASPAGQTVSSEIFLPYKLAAKQLATTVDDVTYKLVYAP